MKVLWLKCELLHPVDKGGRIRTYQMLKHLKRDNQITYLSLVEVDGPKEAREQAYEYCDKLLAVPWQQPRKFSARFYGDLLFNLSSPLPYAVGKYRSLEMQRAIAREMAANPYDVVVCDFLATSVNLVGGQDWTTVLFQHNVESMIWRRHFETQSGRVKKGFFYSQWRKMERYEREACRRFDAVIAVSEVDRDRMRDEFGLREVYDVPTGVDTEYFSPLGGERNPTELVFTGSMDWMPNEDAIVYFAEEILPLIQASVPGVTLTVVGRSPTGRVRELAAQNPAIKVTGRVDDIRPYVDRAAAYIVPLRVGGGTRLKIYEAMAMAKPVISTSIGAEGLPVRDGRDLYIADGPGKFAEAVTRVLTNEEESASLGSRARAVVCERFGWERAAATFAEICESVARRSARKRAA